MDVGQGRRLPPLHHGGAPAVIESHGAGDDEVAAVRRRIVQADERLLAQEDVDEPVEHAGQLSKMPGALVHQPVGRGGDAQAPDQLIAGLLLGDLPSLGCADLLAQLDRAGVRDDRLGPDARLAAGGPGRKRKVGGVRHQASRRVGSAGVSSRAWSTRRSRTRATDDFTRASQVTTGVPGLSARAWRTASIG